MLDRCITLKYAHHMLMCVMYAKWHTMDGWIVGVLLHNHLFKQFLKSVTNKHKIELNS